MRADNERCHPSALYLNQVGKFVRPRSNTDCMLNEGHNELWTPSSSRKQQYEENSGRIKKAENQLPVLMPYPYISHLHRIPEWNGNVL